MLWDRFIKMVLGITDADPVPAPVSPPPVQQNDTLLAEVMDWVRAGTRVDPETMTAMKLAPEDAQLLAEAFTGEQGRRRLMIFARMTVLRPVSDLSLPPEMQRRYADLRQGQDSIFAALTLYLDVHEANRKAQSHDRRPDDARYTGTDERFDPEGSIAVTGGH